MLSVEFDPLTDTLRANYMIWLFLTQGTHVLLKRCLSLI